MMNVATGEDLFALALDRHKSGSLTEAEAAYRALLDDAPDHAGGCHGLGALLFQRGNLEDARILMERAVDLDRTNAAFRYNLSLALCGLGQLEEAAAALKQAASIAPDYFDAHNNLGLILKDLGRLEEAEAALVRAVQINPSHPVGHNNLGLVKRLSGQSGDAEDSFRKAIELNPAYAEAFNNLAGMLVQNGRTNEAEEFFRRALAARPGYLSATLNLAGMLHATGRTSEAATLYREVLKKDPNHPIASHLLNALEGRTTDKAPAAYVASLFDGYAGHFDSHLTGTLGYEVPGLMRRIWSESRLELPRFPLVVDIGCGTGLCGEAFRDVAGTLIGVDLSHKMLSEADARDVYDTLEEADAIGFLESLGESIDLALAGDVLIYLGDAEPLFRALANQVTPDGGVLLSIEASDEPAYALQETGRYAHNLGDLLSLAESYGFSNVRTETCPIRTGSDGNPIEGHILLLQRRGRTMNAVN